MGVCRKEEEEGYVYIKHAKKFRGKKMSSLPLAFDVLTQQAFRPGSQITLVAVWAKKKHR